jgi:pyruvate dehydrogenase E1 component alpha subunit
LRASGAWDDAARAKLEGEIAEEIADAIAFAEAAPLEPLEDLERFVLAEVAP